MHRAPSAKLTPDQVMEFLYDYQNLMSEIDSPTVMISIRIPKNILSTFRILAKQNGLRAYQPLIVDLMRDYVRKIGKVDQGT